MKKLTLLITVLWLGGCTAYSLVPAGRVDLTNNFALTTDIAWNKSPFSGQVGPAVKLWTNNGLSLDRVFIVSGIKPGKPIFKSYDRGNPMPNFESDMLPPELAELVEISMNKLYGEGEVSVNVSELRPAEVSGETGVRFEIDYVAPTGYRVRGQSIAVVKNELLYVVIFDAAQLHYYDKYKPSIDKMFDSIELSLWREYLPLG